MNGAYTDEYQFFLKNNFMLVEKLETSFAFLNANLSVHFKQNACSCQLSALKE